MLRMKKDDVEYRSKLAKCRGVRLFQMRTRLEIELSVTERHPVVHGFFVHLKAKIRHPPMDDDDRTNQLSLSPQHNYHASQCGQCAKGMLLSKHRKIHGAKAARLLLDCLARI